MNIIKGEQLLIRCIFFEFSNSQITLFSKIVPKICRLFANSYYKNIRKYFSKSIFGQKTAINVLNETPQLCFRYLQ
jgi:hypothetical protein